MSTQTPEEALAREMKTISASDLGRRIGITPQAIVQWKKFPAERLVEIEQATGVPRDALRPDLFDGYKRVSPAQARKD